MKRSLLLFFIFCAAASYSQNVSFEGFVRDSTGTPLEMANVLAVNRATSETEAYSITGEKGQFRLSLKRNTSYKVQVSYVGFRPLELDLETASEDLYKDITLQESIMLEGIEIVREMPVSVRGDTIVYNSDSFVNGTERKLEDILKKLPGVEVGPDGQVRAEGRPVSKLMVEGKDFFDGDTKIGAKNIPADAVDKVEVLKNYNEISQLKPLEDNHDNVAMNIKLKEGKKNFWFGDISAGAGPDDRYAGNPKLFYYSPKYSVNFIGSFNNIGDIPFTMDDYFRFSGGLRALMSRGGTRFTVLPAELGMLLMQNNRAKQVDAHFGAANFNYNPSKSWTLSGFGVLSSMNTDMETNSRETIRDTGTGETLAIQDSEEKARQKTDLGLLKLSASYKPHEKLQADYDVFMKSSRLEENEAIATTVLPDTEQSQRIFTQGRRHPFSVSQDLNLYHTLNEKNIFAVGIQHLYQEEDPFYNASLGRKPFSFFGYIDGQDKNNLNQEAFVRTNKLDARLDYYYVITPQQHLNVTLGSTISGQDFNSHIFQLLDNGDRNDLNAPQDNNAVTYAFNDAFAGLHYKFATGKFTFDPGVTYHRYEMANRQQGSSCKNIFYRLLPDVNTLYQIGTNETLSYTFSLVNEFTDIRQLAEGSVFNYYNSLFNGNRALENATSQSHLLEYRNFNTFSMSHLFARINYQRITDAISSVTSFDGINRSSSPFNSNFANENFTANFNYDKSFGRKYKASVGGNVNWSKFYNVQQDPLSSQPVSKAVESFTQTYDASFTTNFSGLPSLSVGYELTINDYLSDTFYTDKPFARLEYFFMEAWTFTADYEFYHYRSKSATVDNEYDFLNASLSYRKKDTPLEYRIGVTNILDTTMLNDNRFSQFSTYTSGYRVQPRYMVLSVIYKI